MIRPFTCVCALLAGTSGLYLYSEKHRTTLLDQQISKIVADTQATRERTAMLRAEWELLNQPDRLGALATRFLPQLQPMAPTQFVQLASLDKRLPAPGPETPPHPILTPETAPSLVGQSPATTPAPHSLAPAPDTAGMAIAQADIHKGAQKPASHRQTELADAGNTQDVVAQATMHRVAAHAVVHAPSAHIDVAHLEATRADAVRRAWSARANSPAVTYQAANHESIPTRYAAYTQHAPIGRTTAAVSAVSAYVRPPTIAAAAWRPAHATWPAPQAASYNGSSLGSSHSTLAAPVPLSDGN
ncbi:MAG: cell division protein FtsL [Janthinobacterium lividum]